MTIFNDKICTFTRGDIAVELASEKLQGYTYWNKSIDGKHEWADSVDTDEFFKEYFSVFE